MNEWYSWWYQRPKKMTKKQIQEMIKNMKKSEIIAEKSKQYHKNEETEADNILKEFLDS